MNFDQVSWRPVDSSFIQSVGWVPMANEYREREDYKSKGWLVIKIAGKVYAYLAKPWVYGLLLAAASSGRSVGRMYGRTIKGKLPRAREEGENGN